jgi:hypothetical protein
MFDEGVPYGGLVGILGGLWQLFYELFVDILRVLGVIAYQFFSCCVMCVAYINISCVVSVTENFAVFYH